MNKLANWSCVLLVALGSMGCASQQIAPVVSDSQIGRVIIYRNGVSYFERYAEPTQGPLQLRVPVQRIDDFLKSLSIVEESTGKTMPVSYPTMDAQEDGYVMLSIKLPASRGRLRISYVTESPAWKPSYRILLQDDGKARLLGWAVVDNVSGEPWKQVRVGVGSSSALSFRYDLSSVRLVEREALSDGRALAAAPPTGGSPYAVAGKRVKVAASLSGRDLAALEPQPTQPQSVVESASADSAGSTSRLRPKTRKGKGQIHKQRSRGYFNALAKRLKSSNQRVVIEGYAQTGDANNRRDSLLRANTVKERLIALGVPESNLAAIGTGRMNSQSAVRILDDQRSPANASGQALDNAQSARASQPVGESYFVSEKPMTLEHEQSAMINLLNEITRAERVYYYDPVSERGSKRFAFNAVRIHNPSRFTLEGGPFTVYAKGQFLGEGLSEPILPKSSAFIPYALDRAVLADPKVSTREEVDRLIAISRGVIATETRRIRTTEITLNNRGQQAAQIYVRHKVPEGYTLLREAGSKTQVYKLGGAHLFVVKVPSGEALTLKIEASTPLRKIVDIRTDRGVKDIALFLKKGRLKPELKARLADIVKRYQGAADLMERIEVLDEQLLVLRQRVDELNLQLVTLRKVPQAGRLKRHLAKRMEEISDKLQQGTMSASDLKGQLMTERIELQDKVAELTLEPAKAVERVAAK